MAVMLPRSIFFHIPKTGGTWIRVALRNAGIPVNEVGVNLKLLSPGDDVFHHLYHGSPSSGIQLHGRFAFTFVRHPYSWYRSMWAYRMHVRWTKNPRKPDILARCANNRFERFVLNVLREAPGYYTRMCQQRIGVDGCLLHFVGRQENLLHDTVRALRMAGEEFDEAALLATPKINIAAGLQRYKNEPHCSAETIGKLYAAERWMFDRFGYDPAYPHATV